MRSMQSILLLALAISLAGCSQDDPASLVASAKGHMAKGDYNASIIQLKNALQKDPKNAEARYLLGVSSLEHGDLSSAEIELGKAIEQGFDTDEAQVALARALLAKGDANKVVSQFATKRLSSPKMQAELRATIGMAELARNRVKEARNAFNEALKIASDSVTANLGIARLAASERDFADAMSRVEKALAASPRSVEANLLKGDVLIAQGQREAAETAYRNAIRAAPNQVPPRLSLIAHLVRLRSLEKASAEVDALTKVAPQDPRTPYARALLLVEQRKFREARESLLQVLKVAPEHIPSLVLAGMAAFEIGAYAEAEGYLRKAVYNAPNAQGAKRLLAATRLRLGQTELALNDVRELLAGASQDPNILALAGEAYLASGDLAAAARYFEQAKSRSPQSAALQTRLAQVRLAAGDAAAAIQELQAASASHPDDYQADLALITMYLNQREADKALEALKTLDKKQPDNPLTHNLRGVSLTLKRDLQGAQASFERAVKLSPTYMPAVTNLVRLDLHEKNTERAKKRYESVLKREPNNEQALSGLALLLRITGANEKEVEQLLRQSVAGNPQSATARTSLVNFYLAARDLKAALTAAQEAQAALPANYSIVEMLGLTQLAAAETRQATSTFLRLAELRPKSPQPLVRLASAYVAAKQPNEAIKTLRAALSLRPDLAVVQSDIAAIYVATGRVDEALGEARAVQAKYPKHAFGYVLEAEIQVGQRNWDSAERAYRELLKKFDVPLLVMRTHTVIEAAGKRSEADAMAESWVKTHPKDGSVLAYLAERDLVAKRYERAAKRYRIALEKQPDNPLFLNNMAWAIHELKQPDALQYAERAHDLAPDNPWVMDTLGSILAQSGQSERGLELLARATTLAPNAYQFRLNFAKALIEAGRKTAARKELETLAKLDNRLPVQQEATALLAGL